MLDVLKMFIKLFFDILSRSQIGTLAQAEILARKIHCDGIEMFELRRRDANEDWKIKLDQWTKDWDSNVSQFLSKINFDS